MSVTLPMLSSSTLCSSFIVPKYLTLLLFWVSPSQLPDCCRQSLLFLSFPPCCSKGFHLSVPFGISECSLPSFVSHHSLLSRASPLLRNAAASRAVSITRHLFASERIRLLWQQQQQVEGTLQQQGEAAAQQQQQQEIQQLQHAASPPQFMARLGYAVSLRSMERGHLPVRQSAAVSPLLSLPLFCFLRCLLLAPMNVYTLHIYMYIFRRIDCCGLAAWGE